jgi:endonuclease IV
VGSRGLIESMQFGLKLASININYTKGIFSFFQANYFQYIELFVIPGSYNDTIGYWKQFPIPIVIHAPHSLAGMNLSLVEERDNNKKKMQETFKFADMLKSEAIIFHSCVNGEIAETINQLRPFVDSRCLIENKPIKGMNDEKCLGATLEEIKYILNELQIEFCLDFGHAICAANTLKIEPLESIKEFLTLNPYMYHLTDGDYKSEYDEHFHYGKGTFPVKELLEMIPYSAKITNEAKHDSDSKLDDFRDDFFYVKNI